MGILQTLFKRNKAAAPVDSARMLDAMTSYFSGHPAWIPQNNDAYIRDGYFINDHVFSIIRLLTRSASTLPIYLYKVTDKKSLTRYKNLQRSETPDLLKMAMYKTKALEQVEDHPILKTLEQPNPLQSQSEFIENVLGFKYLLGNSYIIGYGPTSGPNEGRFQELEVLPAQNMTIVPGKNGEPIDCYVLNQGTTKLPIDASQICHLKSWSPDYSTSGSHLYGVSPLRAGSRKIKVGNDGTETQVKMLQNMGMFGMFTLKDGAAELDATKAKDLERLFYEKQRHKGRVMFTGANFQWQNAGMSPVDLGILESNKSSLRDICNLFSTSSQLLNDPDNKTYNNMKEARKAMWTNAILPDFNSLVGELNRWLVAPFNEEGGETFVLDYDIQAIPELQEDMERLIGYVEKMYWTTFDEKRAITNMENMPGTLGDKLAMPSSLIITDANGNSMLGTEDPNEDEEIKRLLAEGKY